MDCTIAELSGDTTVTGWIWDGSESTDFLNLANWVGGEDCATVLQAPQGLNASVGVAAVLVNDVFDSWLIPPRMPVLSSDYTSDRLAVLTGIDASLDVVGATVTGEVVLAPSFNWQNDVSPTIPTGLFTQDLGTATLLLNNAHVAGNVELGEGARAVLNVSGASSATTMRIGDEEGAEGRLNVAAGADFDVDGGITLGRGTAVIDNSGALNLTANLTKRSAQTETDLINRAGGTVELVDGTDFREQSGAIGRIMNEAGAVFLVTGPRTSTVNWDVENDGTFEVQEGLIQFNGAYQGSGGFQIATGAEVELEAEIAQASAVSLTGDGDFSFIFNGLQPVTLQAVSSVGVSGIFANELINDGEITLNGNLTATQAGSLFRNLDGSVLAWGGGFGLSESSSTAGSLINDVGGRIEKGGTGTSTVFWNVENNGVIDILEGTLSLRDGYQGDGTVNIAAGATGLFNVELLADSTFILTGAGTFDLDLDGGFTATVASVHDIAFSGSLEGGLVNTATLSLTGLGISAQAAGVTLLNQSGALIVFDAVADLREGTSGEGVFTNEQGALLRKTGGASSEIEWDLINDGMIEVLDGELDLNGGFTGQGSIFVAAGSNLDAAGSAADDRVEVTGPGTSDLDGGAGNDTLITGDGNDTVFGQDGDDFIDGGAGSDTLGGGDNDAGGDTISYARSTAAVTVDLANQTASGGHADGDQLTGFENAQGGLFNDQLFGDANDNILTGMSGPDTLDGRDGSDTASYEGSRSRVSIDLATGLNSGGHADGDWLIDIENLIGSEFGDILLGTSQVNTLTGAEGADTLNGRGGDDVLLGGAGNDQLSGGSNDDTITGESGGDRLFGNGGGDSISGGQGNDTAFGGAGNDWADGGASSDELSGQGNNDTLLGGDGADTVRGGSGNDSIEGGSENDRLFGNGNNDTILGGEGDDVLQGAAGADDLFGNAGNDTLTGSVGGDLLDGGAGDDLMNGGTDTARDIFVFRVGYDSDRIVAFDQAGTDLINLDAALWAATNPNLTAQQVVDTFGQLNGTGTILTLDFGGGDVLAVQNAGGINDATLGADIVII